MNLDEIDVSDTFDNIFNNLIKINSYYLNNYKFLINLGILF